MATSKEVQRLASHAGVDAKELSRLIRDLKDAAHSWGFGNGTRETLGILGKIDSFLGNHGIERVAAENGKWAAYYSNAGDTYDATVMVQTRPRVSVLVGRNWGDYIEKYDL
jgi:hypothetical protein